MRKEQQQQQEQEQRELELEVSEVHREEANTRGSARGNRWLLRTAVDALLQARNSERRLPKKTARPYRMTYEEEGCTDVTGEHQSVLHSCADRAARHPPCIYLVRRVVRCHKRQRLSKFWPLA
jgi:hypothetical protein